MRSVVDTNMLVCGFLSPFGTPGTQGREVELPFYGIEGQGWFASYHVFTRYVKVTFLNGASLRPVPPGSGRGPGLALDRHPRGRA